MRLASIIVLVAFTHLISAARVDGFNRRSNSVWRRTNQPDANRPREMLDGLQREGSTTGRNTAGGREAQRLNKRGRGAYDTTGLKNPGVPPPPGDTWDSVASRLRHRPKTPEPPLNKDETQRSDNERSAESNPARSDDERTAKSHPASDEKSHPASGGGSTKSHPATHKPGTEHEGRRRR